MIKTAEHFHAILGDLGNPYLNPEEPTFLGLLIMISLYKSLKR